MALNIRNSETEALAAALAALTGETKTEAVTQALRARLTAERRRRAQGRLADALTRIASRCASLPVLDDRDPDAILGEPRHDPR